MNKIRDRLSQITINTINNFKQDIIDEDAMMRILNDIERRRIENNLGNFLNNQRLLWHN